MKANQKSLIRDERGESDVAGLIGLIFLGIFIILAAPQILEVISDWQKATSVPEDSQLHDLQPQLPTSLWVIRVFGIIVIAIGIAILAGKLFFI
ncbi:hypothetical protein KAX08_00930 [candidate division WOR-3 bacterium]|nr:hypothetical protein [candidate division WOR-3 bacterium]